MLNYYLLYIIGWIYYVSDNQAYGFFDHYAT
jgi:hypothetical protein